MSRVKTNLDRLSVAGTVALARLVVTKLTGNATFPAPSPGLPAFTSATNELQAAYEAALAARAASRQATSAMMAKLAVVAGYIRQEAAYVQNVSAGDATIIESAGFDVAKSNSPIGPLPAPASVRLDANVDPGNMGLKWANVHGAASYVVERAPDVEPHNYAVVANTTVPRAIVNTMTSGQRYWFRIAALGANGQGEWTLPVAKVAP